MYWRLTRSILVYPPDKSEGCYENSLPHIVLTKQALPWLRILKEHLPPKREPADEGERDVPSWLAVLLFTQEEIDRYHLQVVDRKVGDLDTSPDFGETKEDPCRTIDVPMELFQAIAPTIDDLKLLAHIRQVDILRKATQYDAPFAQ